MKELRNKIIPIAIISFLIACVLHLVSLIPVILMPKVIDVYIPERNYGLLLLSIAAFCGAPVMATLGFNFYQYYLMLKSRRLIAELNLKCFDKILHQPMSFFDENYSSELAQKASQDATSYIAVWTIDLPKLLSGIVYAVIIFVILWSINIYIALFQILYIPVSLLLMKLVGDRLEKLIQKVIEFNAKYTKQMQESFRSIRLIKAQVLEQDSCKRVENVQNSILKIWGRVAFFDNFVGGISNTLMPGLFYGGTFVIAAVMAAGGLISIGYLTASVGYASQIHSVFTELIRTYGNFKKAKGETYAIQNYLELEDERLFTGRKPLQFESSICFENVSFQYQQAQQQILTDVSFEVPKGSWLGISGTSGVGKSTILELLMRFYDKDAGAIYIDRTPIEEIDVYDLRSHISYVLQDPLLIQGTIRDNLLLIKPDASETELEEVADKTGILTEIQDGLDKEVGEGGMLLSGGEKQRIAIARCLLEKKELLFLDEITSQMDPKTQEQMIQVIKEDHDQRHTTIISVAHRKEFHQHVDTELVL